jgi:hypothetical protein
MEPAIELGRQFAKPLKWPDSEPSVPSPSRSTRPEKNSISGDSFGYLAVKAVNSHFIKSSPYLANLGAVGKPENR